MEKDETNDNLSKLLGFFNADKIMSKADMEELLAAIVSILASHKKGSEAVSEQVREEVRKAVREMSESHNSVIEQVRGEMGMTKAQVEKLTKETTDRAFRRFQDLIASVKLPKDGKDADPDEVAEIVLAKIKLPENKEFVLTAEDVRDRLESLPDDDKNRLFTLLGSKELTGLKDTIEQRMADAINRVARTRGVKSVVAGSNVTVSADQNGNVTVSATGGSASVSDDAYGAGWDGDTTTAPSRNAVYDKIEALSVGSGTPGGSDTQVQFNDSSAFGGDAGLTYDKTTDTLTVAGGLVVDTNTLVVDATNNRVGIGTASPAGPLDVTTDAGNLLLYYSSYNNAADARPVIFYRKARGTRSAPTAVSSGDDVGTFVFYAHDGTDFIEAAKFGATVDGTPGTNDMPGKLSFFTTADGASTPTERLSIDKAGAVNVAGLTASELVATDASKNLQSLAVATYPSLTELSYAKGVTSAIQTQLDAKAPSTSPTFATSITGSYLTASELLGTNASKNVVSLPVATYPSLAELAYVKGVTSAIQTQLNAKQASDATLSALASYNTNGLLAQTAADTFAGRTITGTSNEVSVSNGDGVSGNPTLSLPSTIDLGGKTSFEIPNSAGGGTIDAAGEIGVDTTARRLNFHDGTAEVVLNPVESKSFVIETPTASDDMPIWRADVAVTLVKVSYLCIGGTNWVGQLQELDANGGTGTDVTTSDTTATAGTTSSETTFSNASIDAGDWVGIKTTSVSGTPTRIHVTFYYRENA